jgi:hypothetical protein
VNQRFGRNAQLIEISATFHIKKSAPEHHIDNSIHPATLRQMNLKPRIIYQHTFHMNLKQQPPASSSILATPVYNTSILHMIKMIVDK